jgi:hypothetical protein
VSRELLDKLRSFFHVLADEPALTYGAKHWCVTLAAAIDAEIAKDARGEER